MAATAAKAKAAELKCEAAAAKKLARAEKAAKEGGCRGREERGQGGQGAASAQAQGGSQAQERGDRRRWVRHMSAIRLPSLLCA